MVNIVWQEAIILSKQTHWLYLFIIVMLSIVAFPILNNVLDFLWVTIWLVIIPAAAIYMLWYEKIYKK